MTREPRWPAFLALLAVGGLHIALPDSLTPPGPEWAVLALVAILLVPTILSYRRGKHRWNQIFGYSTLSVVTLAMAWSLVLLIRALPAKTEAPRDLLQSAAAIWVANIFVFAVWYWRLDAGGPNQRDKSDHHAHGAFLFPQMTLTGRR